MTAPVLISDAAQLRDLWPSVAKLVDLVAHQQDERWISADVYMAILNGEAGCFVTFDAGDEPVGVIILKQQNHYGSPTLFVWVCAHSDPDKSVKDYWVWLTLHAKELGCERIELTSKRPFDKVLPELEICGHIYEAKV